MMRGAGGVLVMPLVAGAILLRALVALNSYSGMGSAPTFGDYEAQRHWMEVTVNLPVEQWYTNSTQNDLSYWGLDYPPLSGYQSWVFGVLMRHVEPQSVELGTSRGYETPSSKLWLRWTVMASDVICYFTAAFACAAVFGRSQHQRIIIVAAMLLNPALLLIDHGHFQYNCISLGLAAGAAAAVAGGRHVLGSALFCCSLSHKQMSLYYAPAFFAHLLGCCLQKTGRLAKAKHLALLAATVCASFALLWAPFLTSRTSVLAVLHRVFPMQRGLFEDYVANFWCVSSLAVKWRRLMSAPQLLQLCTLATVLGFVPSLIHEMRHPTPKGLLLCMANSAMSFFLLSYQVHEKSILLPMLPVTILAAEYPSLVHWIMTIAPFSMFPLLKKDGLVLAYWMVTLCCYAVTGCLQAPPCAEGEEQAALLARYPATLLSFGVSAAIHAVASVAMPPARYPYLFDAVIVSWAFLQFTVIFVLTNFAHWRQRFKAQRKAE